VRLAAAAVLFIVSFAVYALKPVEVRIQSRILSRSADRIGLNLGNWTSWGAGQLCANVLKNPGFEGIVDGAIVIVSAAGPNEFCDDTDWLARPDNFWNGSRFDVLSGALRGRSGSILRSGATGGLAHFTTDERVSGLAAGDVVSITRTDDDELPTQWWFEGDTRAASPDLNERRPGSPGVRSLQMAPRSASPVSAVSYLDAIGERAGKLLPMRGEWTLSFWAKAAKPGGKLHVRLHRNGAPAFLDETLPVATAWQQYVRTFTPVDAGPAGTLELRFETADIIWMDDASLAAAAPSTTAFRDEVISTLKTLRPGYLRDWQGQLGDTLENRTAPAFGRRSFRYRPGMDATDFGYGLPEFLEVAREVGARPWVVLPPTLSDTEWREAGRMLSYEATRKGFREVLVEFGNENWNMLFRPAGIPDGRAALAVASRAFDLLERGSNNDSRLRPVLGGHFFNRQSALDLIRSAPRNVMPAFAPYWAFELPGTSALFPGAHARQLAELAAAREIAIYEMNAHSLNGSADPNEVNQLLSAGATGAALAWHAIGALNAGVRRICVYTLAEFDTSGEGSRLIQLFGVTRDLATANNFRPAGEALAKLNRAIDGEQYAVVSTSDNIRAAAFRSKKGWRVAVASSSSSAERVRLRFPGSESPVEINLPPYGFLITQ
jgi:hypothetical protein